jgi:hypothetical protein
VYEGVAVGELVLVGVRVEATAVNVAVPVGVLVHVSLGVSALVTIDAGVACGVAIKGGVAGSAAWAPLTRKRTRETRLRCAPFPNARAVRENSLIGFFTCSFPRLKI